MDDIGKEGELCLVGGIIAEKPINKEAFRKTMASVWGLLETVQFHEVGDGLYIIKFKKMEDKQRIWDVRPWMFDRNLLVLQQYDGLTQPTETSLNYEVFLVQLHNLSYGCMTREVGRSISASMGAVEKIDVSPDGKGWANIYK